MNREQALKYLPLITALSQGRQIQYKCSGDDTFIDTNSPSFTGLGEYRVKPEPVYEYILSFTVCYDCSEYTRCTYKQAYSDARKANRRYESALKNPDIKDVTLEKCEIQP